MKIPVYRPKGSLQISGGNDWLRIWIISLVIVLVIVLIMVFCMNGECRA